MVDFGQGRRVVVDAKYKLTEKSLQRPQGVQREDLYQMAAYLGSLAGPREYLAGALVYSASDTIDRLHDRGPLRMGRPETELAFLSPRCDADEPDVLAGERSLAAGIHSLVTGAATADFSADSAVRRR